MKLRLRNYESKETLRIQVPSTYTFLQLQETLFLSLPLPHPSPSSLRFSLNAKDLLHAPSPQASLQSLGVAPGDLIYFSLNPFAFSSFSFTQDPQTVTLIEEPNQMPESSANQETPVQELPQFQEPMAKESEVSQETKETGGPESMDTDAFAVSERFSEPYFLRKVLGEELGDNGSIHKLLAIAVHAVFLDSGFVGFDPVSRLQIDKFHLPDEWSCPVSICYSLPELLRDDDNSGSNLTDYVVLKFQTLGHFCQVYGSLIGSGIYKLSLDEYRFAPTLDLVWANNFENGDKKDTTNATKDGSFNSYPENEVFEFWKIVKDGLALPLLIDISRRNDLFLPACLMRLPTELKLKILESLPGADVARMGCVCSEMRYLASNNDLWKQKFEEEFADWPGGMRMGNWKKMFHSIWESRKKQNQAITRWLGFPRVDRPFYFPIRRDPNPFGVHPFVVGGDYDFMPAFAPPVFLPPFFPHQCPRHRGRRNFGPNCNLGEGHNNA
ncbi:F-box protein SKIP22-like [Durio zibethinus]|uniref:F-box protein SKIP22-like n=1 Tax=Durio zibethinus TaxID=66656 RepID=A0A6P6AFG0_DURZI|nr:F-box protein SKIP22-like [Durio zibethinus]